MSVTKQPFSLKDKYACGVRTQAEVAQIMTERGFPMTRGNVWEIERRALKKIRELLADFYRENYE